MSFILTDIIEANIDNPSGNECLMLFKLVDIQSVIKSEEQYQGYSIQMRSNLRWALDDTQTDPYSARIWNDNAILFRVPAFPYTCLNNRDQMSGGIAENVVNAMDDARHNYATDKERRQWKHLLLQFPVDHEISSKMIYSNPDDDDSVEFKMVTVSTAHALAPAPNFEHWLHFTVARTDLGATKRGRVEAKEKKSRMVLLMEQAAREQAARGKI